MAFDQLHSKYSKKIVNQISSHAVVDAIPMITNHRNYTRCQLQEQLISSKCFTSIVSSMTKIADTDSTEVVLFSSCNVSDCGFKILYF